MPKGLRKFGKSVNIKKKVLILVLLLLAILFILGDRDQRGEVLGEQTSRYRSITINDNGLENIVFAQGDSVGEMLANLGIKLNEKDVVFPSLKERIRLESKIIILRASEVTLICDGKTYKFYTLSRNVKEVPEEKDIVLGSNDKISLSSPVKSSFHSDNGVNNRTIEQYDDENLLVYSGMVIKIIRVKSKEVVERKVIAFKTIYQDDPNLYYGETKSVQRGASGLEEETFKVTYENGKEIKRKLVSSKVVKSPVNEIIKKGTKLKLGSPKYGIATWYPIGSLYTTACNIFPRGTLLKVTNTANGKSIIVKVNDTGGFRLPIIVDLSKYAFGEIGYLYQGKLSAKVEEILN